MLCALPCSRRTTSLKEEGTKNEVSLWKAGSYVGRRTRGHTHMTSAVGGGSRKQSGGFRDFKVKISRTYDMDKVGDLKVL